MKKERDYTSGTLVRTDEVLEFISGAAEPVSMAEVVRATGLKQDAVFRVLWNLCRLGWLRRDGGRYRLAVRLALFWARYRSGLEAERDAIDRELNGLEVGQDGEEKKA